MNRFNVVAKAKLRKKSQARRAAKRGERPKFPWKKSRDGASQILDDITEKVTFKEYLKLTTIEE